METFASWCVAPTKFAVSLTLFRCTSKVENTTFRLHRHFFERESVYFREKLSPSAGGEDGSYDSPYTIHGVKVDEFAQFVWVLYNP